MLTDYGIWLVCFAFYAFDSLTRLRPERLIVEDGRRGVWYPVVPILPEQPRQRRFGLTRLFSPGRPALSLPWLSGSALDPRERREVRDFVASLFALGLLSELSFLMLFVVAPLLTALRGLQFAVLVGLAWHLVAVLALGAILLIRRRRWPMGWLGALGVWFECLVCPGYMANACRRVALRQHWLAFDGDRLIGTYARWQDPQRLNALDSYAQELVEDGDLSESQLDLLQARLRRRPV